MRHQLTKDSIIKNDHLRITRTLIATNWGRTGSTNITRPSGPRHHLGRARISNSHHCTHCGIADMTDDRNLNAHFPGLSYTMQPSLRSSKSPSPPLSLPLLQSRPGEAGASDTITPLLTGFTSQQLDSISKIVESAVKTAIDDRLGPLTRQATASVAPAPSLTGRRISNIVASAVKHALDERLGSSHQATPLTIALPLHDPQVKPTDPAQTQSHGGQPVPSNLPDSSHTQSHDLQPNEREVSYRTIFPRLPAGAPHDHPHIVDIGSLSDDFSQRGLGFADLVVTILFVYEPRALTDFLDFSKSNFDFKRVHTESHAKIPCIERRVKFVTVLSPFLGHNSHTC